MKIKYRLIIAMTSVVILMMLLFMFVIQIQFFIMRDLAYFSNKSSIDSIEQNMISYYQSQQSWEGIAKTKKPTELPFMLIDQENEVIWKSGGETSDTILSAAFPISLQIDAQRIGYLYVLTPKQQQVYLIKHTWDRYMYGVVGFASLVGLAFTFLLILLISGTLTRPIRTLTEKIRVFEAGETSVDFHLKRKDEFQEIGDALASMKQNLEQAESARKALVSNVAHELKTPLMVIQGEIELLHIRQKAVSEEKYASISDEIQRLTTIIDDILYLSKAEANQVTLHKQQLNLSRLFEQLAVKTEYLFEQYEAELIFPTETPPIWADEKKMFQVLYNLVQNALIHGKTTKIVKIKVSSTPEQTILSISDDGVGMSKDEIDLIFERFYRSDQSRNRKTGGTGIGLSIVKANVEMHGGKIEVQSRPHQTTFTIRLPQIFH